MINIYSDIYSLWPASLVLSPKLSYLTPELSQVWDFERIAPASAVGCTLKSIQGAAGESLERRHFFNEVNTFSRKKLHEMMPCSAAESFSCAFKQSSGLEVLEIYNHEFMTVNAFNIFTLQKVNIPAILVALDNISVKEDLKFLPSRDTCGCSCHVTLEQAINGSIDEMLERQSLLYSWLMSQANYEVKLDINYNERTIQKLLNSMKNNGEMKIYEITLPGIPGYAFLTIYGNKSLSSTVQYCTGLSYSLNASVAFEKSILELWQSYICMHNFRIGGYSEDEIIDRYQIHFLSCNHFGTFLKIKKGFEHVNVIGLSKVLSCEENSRSQQKDSLNKFSENIYIYFARESVSQGLIWFTKAVCPDFFFAYGYFKPNQFK